VRQLAQRCSTAAREVKQSIEESGAAVLDGRTFARRSGEALVGIVASATQVSEKVADMALSGREQKTGIDQMNRAVANMDSMTQQNAALVEHTASMSHAMRSNAEALLHRMDFFRIEATAADESSADNDAEAKIEPGAPLQRRPAQTFDQAA
jgi:methyl-accepting chemotaxis protein I, serine sensor receptor